MSVDYSILIAVRHWPDVAERLVKSIRQFSQAPIILIDDASPDPRSRDGFDDLAKRYGLLCHHRPEHVQHGICLDYGLRLTDAPWVLTSDHDIIVRSERAFSILAEQVTEDVGAIGWPWTNRTSSYFTPYINPIWALWNAKAMRKYNLSFAGLQIGATMEHSRDFATGQFLCYRMQRMGLGSAEKHTSLRPLRLVPVRVQDFLVHAQVWHERGDTWRGSVHFEGSLYQIE